MEYTTLLVSVACKGFFCVDLSLHDIRHRYFSVVVVRTLALKIGQGSVSPRGVCVLS